MARTRRPTIPNWCNNDIRITGDTAELKRFAEAVTVEDEFVLTRLHPMPEVLEGTTSPAPGSPEPHPNWINLLNDPDNSMDQEEYDKLAQHQIDRYEAGQVAKEATGYTSWYDWCGDNWGTKWGDCETQLHVADDYISGHFQTAWGPLAASFWTAVSAQFPTLMFVVSYREEGMCFEGALSAVGGAVVFDESREMGSDLSQQAEMAAEEATEWAK